MTDELIQEFNTKYKDKIVTATEFPEMMDDLCTILIKEYCENPLKESFSSLAKIFKSFNNHNEIIIRENKLPILKE